MAITPGTYAILSALDMGVRLDVTGGATSQGANLELWTENAGTQNNQIFYIPAESSGYIYLQNPQTGYVVDAAWTGSAPVSGNNLVMWHDKNGNNQRFRAVADSTVTYNGQTVQAYRFKCKANTNLVMDACGGGSRPGTNVWLWENLTWQDGQVWVPIKASAYAANLPVPADIALLMPSGDEVRTVAGARGSVTVYPTFTSAASSHQMRYRTRTRSSSDPDAYRGAWSTWKSIADGSTVDGGWGDAWNPNCTTTAHGGHHVCDDGISLAVDGTTCDLVEVQIEVRAFTTSWGASGSLAHGPSATATIAVAFAPVLTVSAVTFAPDGLRVSYSSDFPRSNNRVASVVTSQDAILAPKMVEAYQDATGYVLHDTDDLVALPDDGDAVVVELALTTTDGVTETIQASQTVAYSGGTVTLSPTLTWDASARTVAVDPASTATQVSVWVQGPQGFVRQEDLENVCYPIGEPWTLWLVAYTSETSWGVWLHDYDATKPDGFRWNWGADWCRVRCGEGEAPKAKVKTSIDGDTTLTVGRPFSVAHIGTARERSISVDGVIFHDEAEALERFERLSSCRFAWLRDGVGSVWRVAVMETSQEPTAFGWSGVSVDSRVVSN